MGYNKEWLENTRNAADGELLYRHGMIGKDTLDAIRDRYRTPLYYPSFFIRLGLFLFSVVILLATLGLVGLTCITDRPSASIVLLLMGGGSFALLEYFIGPRKHFRSGIDDSLLQLGLVFLAVGVIFLTNINDPLVMFCIALPFVIAAAVRYADALVSAMVLGILLCITFLEIEKFTYNVWVFFAAFEAVSLLAIWCSSAIIRSERFSYYHDVMESVRVVALVFCYLCGNLFVVREFHISEIPEGPLPGTSFFFCFTLIVPLLYIYLGALKKDRPLIWTGLTMMILSGATVKYQYPDMPWKNLMIISGAFLFGSAWAAIRYLRKHPLRFTDAEPVSDAGAALLQAEGMVIGSTFGHPETPQPDEITFGGGEFGGGGAGGTV